MYQYTVCLLPQARVSGIQDWAIPAQSCIPASLPWADWVIPEYEAILMFLIFFTNFVYFASLRELLL